MYSYLKVSLFSKSENKVIKIIRNVLLLFSFLVLFQGKAKVSEINFEVYTNWQDIINKAKSEHKCIFVDCYATWCGPCKLMDKYIYSNDTVAAFMNANFISVKVQMDSGKNDNINVKATYPLARHLEQLYTINALPTFAFFSSTGEILHKDFGSKNAIEFIEVAKTALNPKVAIYSRFNNFKNGSSDLTYAPLLIQDLQKYGEDKYAHKVADLYINNFVEKLPDSSFFSSKILEFVNQYPDLINTHSKIFSYYYNYADRIDQIINSSGYAREFACYIISKKEIEPIIQGNTFKNGDVNWGVVTRYIERKYEKQYAKQSILLAKANYYRRQHNYIFYTRNLVTLVNLKKTFTPNLSSIMYLDNCAWEVFKYSNKHSELTQALRWIDIALPMDSSYKIGNLDTKACLLYKLTRVKEAISLEKEISESVTEAQKAFYQKRVLQMTQGKTISD